MSSDKSDTGKEGGDTPPLTHTTKEKAKENKEINHSAPSHSLVPLAPPPAMASQPRSRGSYNSSNPNSVTAASPLAKSLVIALFIIQNSAIILTLRYSRAVLNERYITATTIIFCELLKVIIASMLLAWGFRLKAGVGFRQLPLHLARIMFCREALRMAAPAVMYFIATQCTFIASECISASTYAFLSQLKILFVALFSRLLLKKRLHSFQWRALFLLVLGVTLVQHHAVTESNNALIERLRNEHSSGSGGEIPWPPQRDHESAALSRMGEESLHNRTSFVELVPGGSQLLPFPFSLTLTTHSKGVVMAITSAMLTGLAAVYMELHMKRSDVSSSGNGGIDGHFSVWDRNIQLSCFGILAAFMAILFPTESDRTLMETAAATGAGWLYGYSWCAVAIIFMQAFNGLLVALLFVYLDNIVRGFASSISILLTTSVSYFVFHDVQISFTFIGGVGAVVLSILNYRDTPPYINAAAGRNSSRRRRAESQQMLTRMTEIQLQPLSPLSAPSPPHNDNVHVDPLDSPKSGASGSPASSNNSFVLLDSKEGMSSPEEERPEVQLTSIRSHDFSSIHLPPPPSAAEEQARSLSPMIFPSPSSSLSSTSTNEAESLLRSDSSFSMVDGEDRSQSPSLL